MPNVPRFRYPVGYDPCNPSDPKQSKEKIIFQRPWSRIDTNCVNTRFSANDIQMRLKAETLQYKPKHPQLSNKHKYALAARNSYTKRQYPDKVHIDENGNLVSSKTSNIIYDNTGSAVALESVVDNCPNTLVKIKTSASNVPGPIIDLTYDTSVPLLNFGNPRRTYLSGNS